MKKIILFLALLSLGVSKAQVVGGYLPLNSTKSATIGSIRTNSLVVTAPTISVNNKTLTAGNTGTVAVLSDAVFPLYLIAGSTSPADGATLHIGASGYVMASSVKNGTVNLPYNCTLVGWDLLMTVGSVVGSGETATLSVMANGSSSVTLSSAITFSASDGYNNFNATGLSTNFSANDKINCRFLMPTWATNPTQINTGIVLWFVRRS